MQLRGGDVSGSPGGVYHGKSDNSWNNFPSDFKEMHFLGSQRNAFYKIATQNAADAALTWHNRIWTNFNASQSVRLLAETA
jgi:hypothetical protein